MYGYQRWSCNPTVDQLRGEVRVPSKLVRETRFTHPPPIRTWYIDVFRAPASYWTGRTRPDASDIPLRLVLPHKATVRSHIDAIPSLRRLHACDSPGRLSKICAAIAIHDIKDQITWWIDMIILLGQDQVNKFQNLDLLPPWLPLSTNWKQPEPLSSPTLVTLNVSARRASYLVECLTQRLAVLSYRCIQTPGKGTIDKFLRQIKCLISIVGCYY